MLNPDSTIGKIESISNKAQNGAEMPRNGAFTELSKDYVDSHETATEGEDLQSMTDLEKAVKENEQILKESWEIRRKYLENRIKSSEIQSAIIKGLQEGENIYSLFLQAMRCIALMIDDETVLHQAENDIIAIYGEGLGEPEPLQMCIDQVQERLSRLKHSLGQCCDTDQARRIQQAIKVHENELAILNEKKTRE